MTRMILFSPLLILFVACSPVKMGANTTAIPKGAVATATLTAIITPAITNTPAATTTPLTTSTLAADFPIAEAELITADPATFEPLLAELKDKDPGVRLEAAKALGNIYDLRVIDPLMEALKDPDPEVRAWAAASLGTLMGTFEDPRVGEALIVALQDENAHVRAVAANAMETCGGASAIEPLMTALKDADPEVRAQAARTLGFIADLSDSRVKEALLAVLGDDNYEVRKNTAGALLWFGESIVEPLTAALDNEEGYQILVEDYYWYLQIGLKGTEPVLKKALLQKGEIDMAEAFLNCGNSILEEAAGEWARRHGYTVERVPDTGNTLIWGGNR